MVSALQAVGEQLIGMQAMHASQTCCHCQRPLVMIQPATASLPAQRSSPQRWLRPTRRRVRASAQTAVEVSKGTPCPALPYPAVRTSHSAALSHRATTHSCRSTHMTASADAGHIESGPALTACAPFTGSSVILFCFDPVTSEWHADAA